MKNLIFIALLFVVFQGKAQITKPIDGFLGVKFGSSPMVVAQALKLKGAIPNVAHNNNYKKNKDLYFKHLTLGIRKASNLYVSFVDDKAYEGQFEFEPDFESNTIELYNALVTDINNAYGIRGIANKSFKKPYEEGDGYEITALKTGNATYDTLWKDGDNYISLQILVDDDGSLTLRLYYTDGKLQELAEKREKAKSNSEF
jgi:hypothetical protein